MLLSAYIKNNLYVSSHVYYDDDEMTMMLYGLRIIRIFQLTINRSRTVLNLNVMIHKRMNEEEKVWKDKSG